MILAVGGASSSLALTIKILMETVDANRRATATAVAMTCSYSAYALRWILKLILVDRSLKLFDETSESVAVILRYQSV